MKFEIKRSVTYIMLHHRKRTVMQCGGTCQQTERVLTIQVSHVSLSQLLSCRRSEGSAPYVLLSTREKVVCGGRSAFTEAPETCSRTLIWSGCWKKVAKNIVRVGQRRTVTFPNVVTLPSHLRSSGKARSDEASRNYGTFCKNNPFIPPE